MSGYDYRIPIRRWIAASRTEQFGVIGEELVKVMTHQQRIDLSAFIQKMLYAKDNGLPGQFEECVHNVKFETCGICNPGKNDG